MNIKAVESPMSAIRPRRRTLPMPRLAASMLVAITALLVTAQATSPASATTPRQTTAYTARLVLKSSTGATIATSTSAVLSAPNTIPGGGGSGYQSIPCNKFWSSTDPNGTFTYQHGCGATSSPWGYTISAPLQKIITGLVLEHGMVWTRNGVTQGNQAAHSEYASYVFHGTFNPLIAHDAIEYIDELTFAWATNGQTGTGQITISGQIYQSS